MRHALVTLARLLTPKRRWAQFSLGTMFLVVTVLCVWLARHVEAVNRQRAAVAAIKGLGGECWYDYQFDAEGRRTPNSEPPGPAWLRERLGIDHFADVVQVDLPRAMLLRRLATHLQRLPHLASLWVWVDEHPTADDVGALQSLAPLRELDVISSNEPGAVVASAACLPRLEALIVGCYVPSPETFRYIARLPKLRRLELYGFFRKDRDNQLAAIECLTGLKELDLINTNMSRADVARLRKALPNCTITEPY